MFINQQPITIVASVFIFSRLFSYIPSKHLAEISEFFRSVSKSNDCFIKSHIAIEMELFLTPHHPLKQLAVQILKDYLRDVNTSVQQNSLNSLLHASFDCKEYVHEIFPIVKRLIPTDNIWL